MNPKDIVLNALEEYVPLAFEHLTLSNYHRQDEIDSAVTELEVHFLFPNLTDPERRSLVALDWLRRGVGLGVNTEISGMNECDRKRHEAGLRKVEAEFTQLGIQIKKDVLPRLTPVQKELLTERYLTVPFKQ